MLQIGKLFLIISALMAGAYSDESNSADSVSIEWILKDGLDDMPVFPAEIEFSGPDELNEALKNYRAGEYRTAAARFEKYLSLSLPDGRNSYITLLLAECYRKLGLSQKARESYNYITERFIQKAELPPAFYRILQFAYIEKNISISDSILLIFKQRYRLHPLFNPALYEQGKLYYKTGRYTEAVEILSDIPEKSHLYFKAQFITALSFIKKNDVDKALLYLNHIRKNSANERMLNEINILTGDIYYLKEELSTALNYYEAVSENAVRYSYAKTKEIRILLELEHFDQAARKTSDYMDKIDGSRYFFEMASVLEQAYRFSGHDRSAMKVKRRVYQKVKESRLSFDLSDEMGIVQNMISSWEKLKLSASLNGDKELVREAESNIKILKKLLNENFRLMKDAGILKDKSLDELLESFVEKRYVILIRDSIGRVEKNIENLVLNIKEAEAGGKKIPSEKLKELEELREKRAQFKHEYDYLRKNDISNRNTERRFTDEMQAKFIDWSFQRYCDRKKKLTETTKEALAEKKSGSRETDTLSAKEEGGRSAEMAAVMSKIDIEAYRESLKDEREELIHYIERLLEANPVSKYNPQIMFRLAELYYDNAVGKFSRELEEYEREMAAAEGKDAVSLKFPEYELGKVISTYKEIMEKHSGHWLSDDAAFFLAVSLNKIDRGQEANQVLEKMIKRYPNSEYFVAANMNIGQYYFEHPKIDQGRGYKYAEDAYRRVLYYRDNPQFIEALYRLGWCYYMQDQYEEAISVFKYLIEECDLDFGIGKKEDMEMVNPLMRDEAIDYIAVSFDEERKIEEAVEFLNLIGNNDYAAMVLNRIGELRGEDLDYKNAARVFKDLIKIYPLSVAAPKAASELVKVLEIMKEHEKAIDMREKYFEMYSAGIRWQKTMAERDSSMIASVDSTAIEFGIYVADNYYRKAKQNNSKTDYSYSAEWYRKIINKYPLNKRASEARWNLAVMLEKHLDIKKKAYDEYIEYSRCELNKLERRKQAALNAVAIAQSMLLPDSMAEEGRLDISAVKMLDALKNYTDLFQEGADYEEMILTMGSVYFNRKMYSKAYEIFQEIVDSGSESKNYNKALFLSAKCSFGKDEWKNAAEKFKTVWRNEGTETEIGKNAYDLMLQCLFLRAKQLAKAGAYEQAAEAFINIEEKYPNSKYGDAIWFNSAESYEKLEEWDMACDAYYKLYERYPESKFAPGALFNAASDYENAQKFSKAAEMYELIVSRYPDSDKAKDALFNVGFCYEKAGETRKMAEANERYSQMYPEEKDVEIMLMRSADYYMKSDSFNKAMQAYQNFIRRYPGNPRTVEAYYKMARCHYKQGDTLNAIQACGQAQRHNEKLIKKGGDANNYYASEAAFRIGMIQKKRFTSIKLSGKKRNESLQKQKTELMKKATESFKEVIEYNSERMLEAAFLIGDMLREFAEEYVGQKLNIKDRIKQSVARKDMYLTAFSLMNKSFDPYKKVIHFGDVLDTVPEGKVKWIDSSKIMLDKVYLTAGIYLEEAVNTMLNAPIPDQINKRPLYLVQYKKKLLETIEPLKAEARDYYLSSVKEIKEIGLDSSTLAECADKFGRINFSIGNGYDKLAQYILKIEDGLPQDMDAVMKEEIIFQFEDLAFELQDISIFKYENAMNYAAREDMAGSKWYGKIMERLASLAPDMYGDKFFITVYIESDDEWYVRNDSIKGWNSLPVSDSGWYEADMIRGKEFADFSGGAPKVIWNSSEKGKRQFLIRPVFIKGTPRKVDLYIAVSGGYIIYINGERVADDAEGGRTLSDMDSITGVAPLFKGGDNIIGLDVNFPDSADGGCAFLMKVMLDTTSEFTSSIKTPFLEKNVMKTPEAEDDSEDISDVSIKTRTSYREQYKNRGELNRAIEDYNRRKKRTEAEIKKENVNIKKLMIQKNWIIKEDEKIKNEIMEMKNRLKEMEIRK